MKKYTHTVHKESVMRTAFVPSSYASRRPPTAPPARRRANAFSAFALTVVGVVLGAITAGTAFAQDATPIAPSSNTPQPAPTYGSGSPTSESTGAASEEVST